MDNRNTENNKERRTIMPNTSNPNEIYSSSPRRRKRKKKKKFKIVMSIILTLIIILVGVGVGGYFWFVNSWNSRVVANGAVSTNQENLGTVDDLLTRSDGLKQIKDINNVTNILLLGTDTRTSGENLSKNGKTDMRTDTMLLLSLNSDTKELVTCSLMRDMYVEIPDHGYNKLNSAFAYGGTELLQETLYNNFYIDVDYYVVVDFFSFIDIVDQLGGLDLTLSYDEIYTANTKYIPQLNSLLNESSDSDYIDYDKAGSEIHLNGKQVLAYVRNRYSTNEISNTTDDFGRTSRQRIVLSAIMDKVKSKSLIDVTKLYNTILPYITTNIPSDKMLNLTLNNFLNYSKFKLVQTCLPKKGTYTYEEYEDAGSVLVVDFKKNNNYLFNKIYGINSSSASSSSKSSGN